MRFAEKLNYLIGLRDTNQSRLSRQTGIAQSAISEMTKGKRRPYLDQGFLLARALEVSLDYLADDTVDARPATPLSVREMAVVEMVRAIGPDEAWRRLVQAPAAGSTPEPGRPPMVLTPVTIRPGEAPSSGKKKGAG